MEKINLNDYLASNEYPGRGIAVAMAPDGRQMFIGYFIMGRSENSRNRVFDPVPERGGICTMAADPDKLEDPSLIIYNPVLTLGKTHIVTNGDQTDTIFDLMSQGKSFADALRTRTFEPEYAAICGITKEEVTRDFKPEINKLAEYEDWTFDEAVAQLTAYYDGYHFSRRNMVDVFNPFSLINALADSDLKNYWASSGATSLLPKFVDDMDIRLKDFDNCALLSTIIETSDVTGGGSELFLYQSGYLTIKGYMNGTYLLGIPNFEVKQALSEIVLPTLAMRKSNDMQSTQAFLNLYLSVGNLPEAMKCLKALIADVPYSNKKLASMDMEERYRLIMSTIFNAIGCRVEVEKMIATGRIDMVVEATNIIYVLELKLSNNGGIDAATEQIRAKQYAEPFKADKRKVIALAIELDETGKGLKDWKEVD